MNILSIFVIFVSITGYAGAYTNWKPIILTFSVLVSMGLLGHLYVAKKCLDAVRFTERDMAISWWDVYTDYIRAEIQDNVCIIIICLLFIFIFIYLFIFIYFIIYIYFFLKIINIVLIHFIL